MHRINNFKKSLAFKEENSKNKKKSKIVFLHEYEPDSSSDSTPLDNLSLEPPANPTHIQPFMSSAEPDFEEQTDLFWEQKRRKLEMQELEELFSKKGSLDQPQKATQHKPRTLASFLKDKDYSETLNEKGPERFGSFSRFGIGHRPSPFFPQKEMTSQPFFYQGTVNNNNNNNNDFGNMNTFGEIVNNNNNNSGREMKGFPPVMNDHTLEELKGFGETMNNNNNNFTKQINQGFGKSSFHSNFGEHKGFKNKFNNNNNNNNFHNDYFNNFNNNNNNNNVFSNSNDPYDNSSLSPTHLKDPDSSFPEMQSRTHRSRRTTLSRFNNRSQSTDSTDDSMELITCNDEGTPLNLLKIHVPDTKRYFHLTMGRQIDEDELLWELILNIDNKGKSDQSNLICQVCNQLISFSDVLPMFVNCEHTVHSGCLFPQDESRCPICFPEKKPRKTRKSGRHAKEHLQLPEKFVKEEQKSTKKKEKSLLKSLREAQPEKDLSSKLKTTKSKKKTLKKDESPKRKNIPKEEHPQHDENKRVTRSMTTEKKKKSEKEKKKKDQVVLKKKKER